MEVVNQGIGRVPVRHRDLAIGDAFTFAGSLYVKIAFISTVHENKDVSDGNANAVRLRDGFLKKFDTEQEIVPQPHAKVIY